MDYFIIFLLVIIIFTFLSDKNVISINEIESKIKDINKQIDIICESVLIVNIYENIKENRQSIINYINEKLKNNPTKKYIILLRKDIKLSSEGIRTIIANYINVGKKTAGFIPSYEYANQNSFKDIIQELKVAAVNYISIFAKSCIDTYGAIILNKNSVYDIIQNNKINDIVTFESSKHIKITCNKNSTNDLLKEVRKIYDTDIKVVLKSGLLILVGITVTANLISALYSMNITNIIVSSIIYWCYNFVLKYMYRLIGKYRLMSKYLFPIFLIIYLTILILGTLKKLITRNKKVHAS